MDKFLQALAYLLPTGFAWPRDPDSTLMRVLRGLAGLFDEFHQFTAATVRQWQPATTVTRLAEWEEATGLPDPCFAAPLERVLPGRYKLDQARVSSFARGSAATYIDDAGVVRMVGPNVQRYEAGMTLVEAAAVNLLVRSTDFADAAAWSLFDMTLPGHAPNWLPGNIEIGAYGGGWAMGPNLTRVGPTTGPTGLSDAVIYTTTSNGNAFLVTSPAAPLANNSRYKLAVWAKLVAGAAPTSTGFLALIDTDLDNSAPSVERSYLPMTGSGLDGQWRRFFLEVTTGSAASDVASQVYLAVDWANGAQIAFAQPVLIKTQGGADFADITLNDPAVAAPDGSFTAMKFALRNAGLIARQVTGQFVNGSSYTPSIWLYYPSGPATTIVVNDDVAQVAVSVVAAPGWQRYKLPLWSKGASGGAFLDFEVAGSLTQPLWLWGPQCEAGTDMTSLIVTGSGVGSRAADQVYLFPTEAASLDLRRKLLLARLRGPVLAYANSSPASPGAIEAICASLGYTASVCYNVPFRVGRNRVGDRLGKLDGVLYVRVAVSSADPFRVGVNRVGDRLVKVSQDISALECYLRRIVPARYAINVTFAT